MRLLDGRKVAYTARSYEPDATMTGEEIARLLSEDPGIVYKTLVTEGRPGRYYVFVIPVRKELDLKRPPGPSGRARRGLPGGISRRAGIEKGRRSDEF